MRISLVYIALCLCISSCIKEIPYEADSRFPSTPAIHCFITPDSIISSDCRLTAPFGSRPNPIADATFTLWKGAQYMDSSVYDGNGLHLFKTNSLKAGDSFVFKGRVGGIQPFSIQSVIPNSIPILALDTSRQLIPGLGRAFSLAVRFNDNPLVENNYRCFLYKVAFRYVYDYNGQLTDSFLKKEIIALFSNELPVLENDFNNYSSREVLFTDATFNGVNKNMTFYTSDLLLKTRQERPIAIEFHLENINKSLFDFYNTRNAHIWQQQSISQLPGNIKGNIPDAFGVVGAYTSDHRYIGLKQ